MNDVGTLVAIYFGVAYNFADALKIFADLNAAALVSVFARLDDPEGLSHGLVAHAI